MERTNFKRAYILLKVGYVGLLIITLINFNKLPSLVPINWNACGSVNTNIEKSYFLLSIWILYMVSLLVDPLSNNRKDMYYSRTNNICIIIVLTIFLLGFAYILLKLI